MTYNINGIQYWRRNGVCCSWTKEDGRKVISEDDYMSITGSKKSVARTKVEDVVDPKSKVKIIYQVEGKSGNLLRKNKIVTYGNLDKVIKTMQDKDNSVIIITTERV